MSTETIVVDAAALRSVLQALVGPPHLIRELQCLRYVSGSPIDTLLTQFNEWWVSEEQK